jgi:hypothetical protein
MGIEPNESLLGESQTTLHRDKASRAGSSAREGATIHEAEHKIKTSQ